MEKIKYRMGDIAAYITLILLASFIIYQTFGEYQRTKPIDVMSVCQATILPEFKKVKTGSWIGYHLVTKVQRELVGDNDRRVMGTTNDGRKIIFTLPTQDSYKRPIGKHDYDLYVYLPEQVPPGKYRFHTTVTWPHERDRVYNPLSYETDEFEVVK